MLSTVLPALCSAFNLNNKNVNALIACKLWGFTCTRSLTMNLNFQYRSHKALPCAVCGIEIISCLLLLNLCSQIPIIHTLSALTCN